MRIHLFLMLFISNLTPTLYSVQTITTVKTTQKEPYQKTVKYTLLNVHLPTKNKISPPLILPKKAHRSRYSAWYASLGILGIAATSAVVLKLMHSSSHKQQASVAPSPTHVKLSSWGSAHMIWQSTKSVTSLVGAMFSAHYLYNFATIKEVKLKTKKKKHMTEDAKSETLTICHRWDKAREIIDQTRESRNKNSGIVSNNITEISALSETSKNTETFLKRESTVVQEKIEQAIGGFRSETGRKAICDAVIKNLGPLLVKKVGPLRQ